MTIIKCSECGGAVSNRAKTCPHCGFQLSKEQKKRKFKDFIKSTKFKIIAVCLLALIVTGIGYYIHLEEQRSKRAAEEALRFSEEITKDAIYPWRQWDQFDLTDIRDYNRARSLLERSELLPDSEKWYEGQLIIQHFHLDEDKPYYE